MGDVLGFPPNDSSKIADENVDKELMAKQQQEITKRMLIEQRMSLLTALALSTDPYFKDLPIMAKPSGVLDANNQMRMVPTSPAEIVTELHVEEELAENLKAIKAVESGIITVQP